MHTKRRGQAGDTLLEIIIAVMLIGISMSVLFYAFSISTSRSGIHQDLVTANGILRSYAENTKAAVRTSCPGASFTPTYTLPANLVTKGFTNLSPPAPTTHNCPAVTTVLPITLSVDLPNGEGTKTLDIDVRTP